MVENIYRELAPARRHRATSLHEVILAAAKDVDRPIFYSVAVILAGYLPIYALSGPSAKLFHPMAETMSFALIGRSDPHPDAGAGAGVVLVQERRARTLQSRFRMDEAKVRDATGLGARASQAHHADRVRLSSARLCCWFRLSAASSCRTSTKARSGCAPPCRTPFRLKRPSKIAPQVRTILMSYPAGHGRHLGIGTARRRHRSHRLLQLRILCRPEALQRQSVERRDRIPKPS